MVSVDIGRRHLLILTGLIVVTIGGPALFLYAYPYVGGNPTTVVDCRGDGCSEGEIRRTYSGCGEFYAGDTYIPPIKDNCNRTTQGIGEVSMVTDPANHITSRIGDASYEEIVVTAESGNWWDLEFLPDGLLVTEKDGDLVRIRDGERTTVGEIDVFAHQNLGLMGLAVDPNFDQNRYIYLHYSYENVGHNWARFPNELASYKFYVRSRVSRFKLVDGALRNETVLIDDIPGSTFHGGGRLEIGPYNKLYTTTGDASFAMTAPFKEYYNGKYMRINRNGSIPASNPYNNSPVYTMGHRNPQGIAWNPDTGTMWGNEHGNWRYDEVNKLEAGEVYGWPAFRCNDISNKDGGDIARCLQAARNNETTEKCQEDVLPGIKELDRELGRINFTAEFFSQYLTKSNGPQACLQEWTLAPSGATFVDEPGHPWHGDLFVAGLRSNHVHRFHIDDGEIVDDTVFYIPGDALSERIRDVEFHSGDLWVVGDGKGIVRLSPA